MKILHSDEDTKIVFTWKERLIILFKGFFKFDHYNSYVFSCHLMEISKRSFEKHGDFKKHGEVDPGQDINIKK